MTEQPQPSPAPASSPLHNQPHAIVERDGVRFTLLGTAHVSKSSVDAVRAAIAEGHYDTVAVELDPQRFRALTDPDALAKLDLVKVLREGKTAVFAANLALAAYQRRLAEQLDIEPGAELKAAALDAQSDGLDLHLIDRDVGLTFKRAMQRLGWWGRAKVSAGLAMSLFADEEVSAAQIEGLKEGDILEASFGEFATDTPALFETVIAERDRYMAAQLRQLATGATQEGRSFLPASPSTSSPSTSSPSTSSPSTSSPSQSRPREVLAVVGAGHLQGMVKHLREDQDAPASACAALETVEEKSKIPWFTILLAAFVLGGFAWGFWRGGLEVGADLVLHWALVTGTLGAIGCALAGGHPLSILTAFVASPVTPLHPALASGTLSALVEAWVRKPTYADFMALRDDVQTVKGWWRNRVARVLLNFFLTSMGTAIGVWTGGARLLSKLIG
jgi:pheromone shutdown protein TraB